MSDGKQTHVRELFGDEAMEIGQAIADYAFEPSPQKTDPERLKAILAYSGASRFFVADADKSPQAYSILYAMTENVRGQILPMGGIGEVGSLPAGRRQGHVRQMLTHLFAEMHAAGHVVSTLYPFRESFYERLGYASVPRTRFVTFNPSQLAPLVRMQKPGYVTQEPMATAWETWRGQLETIQRTRHGFALSNTAYDVRRRDNNTAWVAFDHNDSGEITGSMTFRITGYGKRLEVKYFYPATTAARYLLLDWIGRHTDQVSEISIEIAPGEIADLWFQDLRAQTSTINKFPWPGPMGRIISVTGLTGIDAGNSGHDHEIAINIVDDLAPWNNGVHTFAAHDGKLTVTPGGKADTTLTIQALSALVYTGHDPSAFVYRGWGDPDLESQEKLRALFPPVIPFLHEEF